MTRLLVIGDALLDRDVVGRAERLAPDAPVPVVDVEEVRCRPGGAALAAVLAAAAPDVEVTLACAPGGDAAGRELSALISGTVELLAVPGARTTPSKTRVRVRGQSLLRLDEGGDDAGRGAVQESSAEAGQDPSRLRGLRAALLRSDAVLVADYGGALTRDPELRDLLSARASGKPVVWDPHPRGLDPVPGCVVTPNRAEATRASAGTGGDAAAPAGLDGTAAWLRRRWDAQAVVVTDGPRGVVVDAGVGAVALPAPRTVPDEVDSCGAGDHFAGTLAVRLGRGDDVTTAAAAAMARTADWLANGGIQAWTAGAGPRPRLVAAGGCFDVLHAGHVTLLQAARALGDRLVVLVNSDRSVRRLKGPTRPIHREEDRVAVLRALGCVDEVVVFDEDTPTAALARLRPDVWVKGDDYRDADLPEARTLQTWGGRVVFVPRVPGHSSTAVVQRLAAGAAR